jgi:hypothetical protein
MSYRFSWPKLYRTPSLRVLSLTLALAEALAASELLAKKLISFSA